jgi:hypothetical protein
MSGIGDIISDLQAKVATLEADNHAPGSDNQDIDGIGTNAGNIATNASAVSGIQTALNLSGDPAVYERALQIGENEAEIIAINGKIDGLIVKVDANTDYIAENKGDISKIAGIEARSIENAELIAEVKVLAEAADALSKENAGLIAANTEVIDANAEEIADNLAYINYIEEALEEPGASGISKYKRSHE